MPHQRERPRERLVQTALKLFASRGYHNTSIEDILKESDCTRGALYYYFSSKEELGYAAIDEELRVLFEEATGRLQTGGHPIDVVVAVVDALPHATRLGTMRSSVADVAARMAAVHEGFRHRLAQGLEPPIERLERILRRGIADGQVVDTVDPHQLTSVIATMATGIEFGQLLWNQGKISEDARGWLKEYLNSLRK